jgi:glycosyltransferase involved in cell wall biosynthesis
MTTVSVIIPTFNRAAYLPACIASIVNSGIPNLEILVVDDGSTDNTASVVRSCGSSVRYVRQENAGPAAARNLGTLHSHGRYLCYLDSDDAWLSDGPAALFAALERHPRHFAAFGDTEMGSPEAGFASFIDTYGGAAFRALPSERLDDRLVLFRRGPLFRRMAIRNVMFLGSLMIRREAIEEVGGFHESLCGAADWDFFLRLAARFNVMHLVSPPVARYLKHESAMSNDASHMNRDFMLALAHVLEVVETIDDIPAADREHVRRLLRRHRFDWGYEAYDAGRMAEARRRFASAIRESGPSIKAIAYLALSCAPREVVQGVRRFKRLVAG